MWTSPGLGHTCPRCGCWVSPNSSHYCQWSFPQTVTVSSDPALVRAAAALERIADVLEGKTD